MEEIIAFGAVGQKLSKTLALALALWRLVPSVGTGLAVLFSDDGMTGRPEANR
jgi:hypothetical protein